MTLTFCVSKGQLFFIERPSCWICLICVMIRFRLHVHSSDVGSFLVHRVRRQVVSICPITGDGNFSCLVNEMSASFLLHPVNTSPS